MMRIIVFIFIFQAYTAYARVEAKQLSKQQIKTMSFIEIQNLRRAYLDFFNEVNTATKYSDSGEKKFSYLEDFLIKLSKSLSAYALENGDMCFFGGWATRMKDNYCEHPSKHSNDPELKGMGDIYNRGATCGQINSFRCNPLLFGAPKDLTSDEVNGVKVLQTPDNGLDKGYCVIIDSYENLTDKCEQVSEDSISDIINDLKNNPDKQQKLQQLNELILGDNGFCPKFRADYGKEYDACDNLERRLNTLLAEQKENDIEPTPQEKLGHQDTKYAAAMRVLNHCEEYLPQVDSDDVFSRNITQKIRGGIISCRPDTVLPLGANQLTSTGLKEVSDRFNKEGYLNDLNREKFKSQVLAYFAADKILNRTPDKERYIAELKKHNPYFKAGEFEADFNEVFEQFSAVQGQMETSVGSAIEHFNEVARGENNSVQQICNQIYEEFHKQNLHKRGGVRKKAAQRNQKQKEFYTKANSFIKQKLDQLQSQTEFGFLMATDAFQDNISDTEYAFENFMGVDYGFGKECAQKKDFQVVMPLTEKVLNEAVSEVKEEIFDEMEKLPNLDYLYLGLNIEEEIDEYLKYNPAAVLNLLLKADNQEDMAKYICHRVEQIYDGDEFLQFGKIVGGSALTAVGGLVCLVPVPGARVACAGIMAKGVQIAVDGAVDKGVDAHNRSEGNQRAAFKGELSFTEYLNEERIASNQMNEAIASGTLNLIPLVNGVKPFTSSSNALVHTSKAKTVTEGTELATQQVVNSGDDALRAANAGSQELIQTANIADDGAQMINSGSQSILGLKLDPITGRPFKVKPQTDTLQKDALNRLFNPETPNPLVRTGGQLNKNVSNSSYGIPRDPATARHGGGIPSPIDPQYLVNLTAAQIYMALPEKSKTEKLKQNLNLPQLIREDKDRDFYMNIEKKLFANEDLDEKEFSKVQARLAKYLGLQSNKISADLIEERVRKREDKLNTYRGDSAENLILVQENYLLNLLFESLKKAQSTK